MGLHKVPEVSADAPLAAAITKVVAMTDWALEALIDKIAKKLAELIELDEAGWPGAAEWIDHLAMEEGIDLFAEWDDPKKWAWSVVARLRQIGNIRERFPEGPASLDSYENAEELFWAIHPTWRHNE